MIPWKYRQIWYDIRDWFNPRQKWLFKRIPNHWVDKDTLWEICILEGIKHYVEQEHVFDVLCNDNPPEQAEFLKEVRENYRLITEVLPSLEQGMELAWKEIPHRSLDDINKGMTKFDYDMTYGVVNKFEKEIADLKTKVMWWAVTNRESIWT
jgi:hypothetical protein